MRRLPLIVMVMAFLALAARGQPSEFTYQGEIVDGGAAAEGVYDLRFKLFDGATGEGQVSSTLCVDNMPVHGGRFATALDFGLFTGEIFWLQVEVRRDTGADCSNSTGWTVMTPRQKLTAAPWAGFAATAQDARLLEGRSGVFYQNAANLFGALPSSSLAGTYSQVVQFGNAGNSFFGSGQGLTSLNATALATGVVPEARLSSNVALLNRANTFTGLATFNGGVSVAATTRFASVAAQGFQPGDSGTAYTMSSVAIMGTAAGTPVLLFAPVSLPHGAVVTELAAWVVDNDAAQAFTIDLNRVRLDSAGSQTMATVTTTAAGASTAIQTLTDGTVGNATVDDQLFGYVVQVRFTAPATQTNMQLRGVRVTYTVTSPLP